MRPSRIQWTSKLLYSGLLPSSVVTWLVWRRLGGNSKAPAPKSTDSTTHENHPGQHQQIEATDLVQEEAAPHPALSHDSPAPLSPRRPSVSVADAVAWQLQHHQGFLPAFISSIQHAPISNQHGHWRRIGARLARQREEPSPENTRQGLREGRVLLVLGADDDVVLADEVAADAREVLGAGFVEVAVLDGGHDVPVARADAVTDTISRFWSSAADSAVVSDPEA